MLVIPFTISKVENTSAKSLSKYTPIVGSDYPVAWLIREALVNEENVAFYRREFTLIDVTQPVSVAKNTVAHDRHHA